MRIGLLGCGTIGFAIAEALGKHSSADPQLVIIADQSKTPLVQRAVGIHSCSFTTEPNDLVNAGLDWVIEAAGQDAIRQYLPFFLDHGLNVLVMSVGALVDETLLTNIRYIALAKRCCVRIPSGAIGGLDTLRSAQATSSLKEVEVTTTKPPRAWEGAPYLEEKGIDLSHTQSSTLLFEGTAAQAVAAFPKNVNVVASVSLAGIGFQRTRVRAIADPACRQNVHQVSARGAFGEMELTLRNVPSVENPRTSFLASSSAIAACLALSDPIQIGVG